MMNVPWWYYVIILAAIAGCGAFLWAQKQKREKEAGPKQKGIIR